MHLLAIHSRFIGCLAQVYFHMKKYSRKVLTQISCPKRCSAHYLEVVTIYEQI
jgi:hypothetical protein